ncbi:MAG: 3-isopropylmalate dehydrogenase [Selenomonadaceae bacterium]|nr:3-isopropylmalate dehydrogenase [Selenomonadaceae bacterium]
MKKIIVIPGDGVGKEITQAAQLVLTKVSEKFSLDLTFEEHIAGGAAIDAVGVPLPDETLEACRNGDAILFGAVGGKKWDNVDPSIRPEKALLGIRKAMGLYANLRPVKVFDCLAEKSPLKTELVRGVDMIIVRELVGGIYFGERCESEIKNGVEQAWDTEIYSVPEIERISKLAFESAESRRKKVTSVDKANILATSRLWRKTVANLSKNYSDIELDNLYVDNAAMQLALNPKQFDVIVTSNMFGDILSDEAAVITGSIGMMPSASIGELTSFYEPIHGSAPDIAGLGIANPIGTILSAAMLLRYSLKNESAAQSIENAVDKVLADGLRTPDIYDDGTKKVSTEEMAQAIKDRI